MVPHPSLLMSMMSVSSFEEGGQAGRLWVESGRVCVQFKLSSSTHVRAFALTSSPVGLQVGGQVRSSQMKRATSGEDGDCVLRQHA